MTISAPACVETSVEAIANLVSVRGDVLNASASFPAVHREILQRTAPTAMCHLLLHPGFRATALVAACMGKALAPPPLLLGLPVVIALAVPTLGSASAASKAAGITVMRVVAPTMLLGMTTASCSRASPRTFAPNVPHNTALALKTLVLHTAADAARDAGTIKRACACVAPLEVPPCVRAQDVSVVVQGRVRLKQLWQAQPLQALPLGERG